MCAGRPVQSRINWRTDRKGRRCVAGRGDKAGYATIEIELKNEKAAERSYLSYIERTAPKEKELTKEQLAAKAAARKAKKTRQKARRAQEAGERAASEAERSEPPRAQLRESIQYVMAGLRSAAAQAHSQAGSIHHWGRILAAPGEGRRVSTRPQQAVRHSSPGDRGDDGCPRLARERAGRARQD